MIRTDEHIENVLNYVGEAWRRHPDMALEELIERSHCGTCCSFIDDSALMDGLATMEREDTHVQFAGGGAGWREV